MTNLKVREAEAKDDQAIGELLVNAFVTAYAQKMPEVVVGDERKRTLRDVATKRNISTVLVAEQDGQIVGTVSVFKPGAETSEAWIKNAADLRYLALNPLMHGKGLSKHLLDEAEKTAWSWGVEGICLHVRRGAHGVARLYQSRGFVRCPEGDLSYPSVFLEAYFLKKPAHSE